MLRLEGKQQQAEAMMNLIRKQRYDKLKARYDSVKGVVDRNVDRLTKGLDVLLDSDSDKEEETKSKEEESSSDESNENEYFQNRKLKQLMKPSSGGGGKKSDPKHQPSSPGEVYSKSQRPKPLSTRHLRPVFHDDSDEDIDDKDYEFSSSVCTVS